MKTMIRTTGARASRPPCPERARRPRLPISGAAMLTIPAMNDWAQGRGTYLSLMRQYMKKGLIVNLWVAERRLAWTGTQSFW